MCYRNQSANLNLSKIERGLQKIKKGTLPKSPQTIDEIHAAFEQSDVFDTYGSTLQTKDLDGNDLEHMHNFFDIAVENKKKKFSFCVFSSKTTLELIEKNIPIPERHILMDATFRIVPIGPFKQLLIMYIRKHRKVN